MRLFIYLFILLCSFDSIAQYNWDSKDWDKKSLGFGCGFSGQMTKPISRMSKLLAARKFKAIRETLNSSITADQYIATYVLQKLKEKGELELSDLELKRMEQIKNSKQKIPICSGCTYWDEVQLCDLFDVKTQVIISTSADYWFERHYKENK